MEIAARVAATSLREEADQLARSRSGLVILLRAGHELTLPHGGTNVIVRAVG